MKTVAVAVVFTVLGAVAGAGVMAWEPWADNGDEHAAEEVSGERTLSGTMTLGPDHGFKSDGTPREGDECWGAYGKDDIRAGAEVTVKDGADNTLAFGRLDPGIVELVVVRGAKNPKYCVFSFELTDVPEADFYSIEVGGRGDLSYSYDELEAMGWTVAFELEE